MTEPAEDGRDLSPTQRLLCACARRPDASVTPLPLEAIDWSSLPPLLVRHGLLALAATHLSAVRERIPASVWREIHTAAPRARADALALSAELLRIVREFSDAGVDVLPYKGPLLAWEAYGDLGVRPFADLDLLTRPQDLERAATVLRTLGYRPTYAFPPACANWFRRVDGDYPFVHAGTDSLVELHVRALSRRFGPEPATEDLWRRRRTLNLAGTVVPAPRADDVLYLQLVHGAKHRWERLEWIASTAELLRIRNGDVSALLDGSYPNTRAVLLGCLLAHRLLGAPLDAGAAALIARDRTVRRLAAEVPRHLFREAGADDAGPGDTAAKLWFNFRLQRGGVARARFLYRWVAWPSPEDWEHLRLPRSMFFLYRILRPIRLLWRYARPSARPEGRNDG